MAGNHYSQSEAKLTLGLLKAVDGDEGLTQRSAARDLGVALGLVNTYLKRCVKKGLIKVRQVPSNRYAYYLTPKGFSEKSRLTAEYLTQSLSLFRQAQQDCEVLLDHCTERSWTRLALYGLSDLTEIIALYVRDYPVELVGVVSPDVQNISNLNCPVVADRSDLGEIHAYIITDLSNPQPLYEQLAKEVPVERILTPRLLDVSRIGGDVEWQL
jgi:DNA-binding MarR family transcriptional regulator